MELNGPVAGTGYDQVVASSSATTGATVAPDGDQLPANLSLSLGFAPANNSMFWLINNKNTRTGSTTAPSRACPRARPSRWALSTESRTPAHQLHGQLRHRAGRRSGNDVVIYGVTNPNPNGSCCVLTGGSLVLRRGHGGPVRRHAGAPLPRAAPAPAQLLQQRPLLRQRRLQLRRRHRHRLGHRGLLRLPRRLLPGLPCITNADFNGDGDMGTDADIEAFFRVLAGGSC